MSIETLLTLGLAAAILVAAALLRLLILGAVRLFCLVTGRAIPWRRAPADAPSKRGPGRPLARPVLNALGSVGRAGVYVLATLGTWLSAGAAAVGRGTVAALGWLRPRVSAGAQKGLVSAGRGLRSVAIVTVASAQHLGHVTAGHLKEIAQERSAHDPIEEEPVEGRVIVLDREWDPLTDPLEDAPASSAR